MNTKAETDYKTKLAQARAKFGRPFAHEPKSTYQPEPMPFLARWFRKDANRSSNSLL